MRKITTLATLLAFVLLLNGIGFSAQDSEDSKFQKVLEEYFDAFWKFYPTAATMAGYHKYDDKLEDFSKRSLEKRQEALDKFNQEFVAKVDSMKLTPDVQSDHAMIVDALDLELLKIENLLPWEYDPLFYNEVFINTIRSLLTKEFAPLDTRAKNATERLKELPKLIKEAKDSLKTPPEIFTKTAIHQFSAVLDFYKNQLPQLIDQCPESHKSKLQSNLSKALPALEDYQRFLTNELLPRSTGNFRLGEAHPRLVRLTFQNNIPLQELIARAQADYKNIRREMFLVCIPFYKIMDPKINLENPPPNLTEDQLINTTISHVLDKIKGNHVAKDEFVEQIKSLSGEIKDFLMKNQLVDLPEEDVAIEPMPQEYQGITLTRLSAPGAYERGGTYSCQIAPFDGDLTDDQIVSLLEEYNNYFLYFYTNRKVFPGHFVPLYLTRKDPSLVRKLYPNMPLLQGWPLFIEETMIQSGLGNYDLRMRLNQLKFRLKAVVDFIIEFNIHEAGMTKEQAVAYMMRGGFQTEAEAERNWNRIALRPVDAAFAYVGMQELIDLEKEYKQLKGDSFSQKEFLSRVLSHGAMPFRHLKKKILE
jgi:uncharacterized protein (DUF885 family)